MTDKCVCGSYVPDSSGDAGCGNCGADYPPDEGMVKMTVEWATILFEEWKRRYDADPDGFMDCDQFKADPPASYGEGAARYFFKLDEEMGGPSDG